MALKYDEKKETEHICGLRREDFQATINGKKTDLYFLKNNGGNVVAITNYGGALVMVSQRTVKIRKQHGKQSPALQQVKVHRKSQMI